MMQYRLLKVLFATIISLFLCACVDKEDEFDMQFSSTDRLISELVTCEYSNSELEDIVSTATTIQALNARYPIECIRDCGNIVRVSYCGDDAVAVILFDNKGNRIMGRVFTTYRLKDDFETINIGSCLNSVNCVMWTILATPAPCCPFLCVLQIFYKKFRDSIIVGIFDGN